MSKARIALVGTGWWATTTHLPALQAHPDAEIAAICDLDACKARKTADVFGIASIYSDFETMLERETLDGVMVATHHAAHYPVARACLERGKHVFIEKPMTLRAKQARALVELASAKDRQIVMGYNSNHSALAVRAREVVRSGELGAVQFINGLFSQHIQPLLAGEDVVHQARLHGPGDVYGDPVRSGGGHGHLQITHLAGMTFFITGLRVARVRSLTANHGLKVDLAIAILAELDGGALANLGGSGNLPGGGRSFRLTITCERGWIELDDSQGRLIIRREGEEPERYDDCAFADSHQDLDFAPTHNFVDVILGRAENHSDGLIGWRAAELLDAAYRSAAQGGAAVSRDQLYAEQAS
ncbi:MAG: Gfo/Idh/MocA family oxidoreductase [Chloroflexi bacterium]|nr:Gfo/Idh/MocA family oxidoreductase [Chloroflexota bacterium]